MDNAIGMGIAYILGGIVPVLPYLLFPIPAAMPASILASACALFTVGGVKGRLVRQSWWRSGLEMLAVAGLAAAAGFLVGHTLRLHLP